jgi:hypothetical protein
MGQKSKDTLAVRPQSRGRRSRSRSPNPKAGKPPKIVSYASDGVRNNDILNLPASDYKLLVLVTLVAAAVRLFRIYQPSSVVFDEVQYVLSLKQLRWQKMKANTLCLSLVSVASRASTLRESSSWMSTRHLPNC